MTHQILPQVLNETPEWLVLSKPSGWLSIPGRGEASAVLYDWVRERYPEALVVHRLDRETSGVILFARCPEAHRRANGWFQDRKTKKIYDFLATGEPVRPILKINSPIEGAASLTQVEIRERFGSSHFLGVARPLTGRRHQIRIHLSQEGFPLLGDSLYNGAKEVLLTSGTRLSIPRVALHARILELPSGEKFEAPLTEDFSSWIQALRGLGEK